MRAGYVEPQWMADSYSCPHCGAFSAQTWYRLFISGADSKRPLLRIEQAGIRYDAIERIENEQERELVKEFIGRFEKNFVTYKSHQYGPNSTAEMANLCLSHCFACKGFSIWVGDDVIYPQHSTEIEGHEEMPPEIRRDFDEAASIINLSPRGAAALLRLCIQQLMPILGEKGKNLNDDISSLVARGLEPEIQQALDLLRVIGNHAVHPGEIDLRDDKSIAVKLFELVNLIVERRIATPKRIGALFSGLPEKDRKAIERRDGKPESP
jgi:hypothetical protein